MNNIVGEGVICKTGGQQQLRPGPQESIKKKEESKTYVNKIVFRNNS